MYESLFVVKGGAALDALEEIVRDRLGIGAPPHGVHLSYFGRAAYTLHNLVLVRGSDAVPAAEGEVVFLFEKPRAGYGEFRESVGAIADRLLADLSPERIELWQRKLGLGVGTEFILRVRCREAERTGVAAWMAAADAGDASGEALVRGSACVFTTTVHA